MTDENGGELVGMAVGPLDENGGFHGQRSKLGRAVLWCVIAVTLSAAVAVALVRTPPASADSELKRLRGFVAEARTARFSGTSRSESGGGTNEPGSTSIDTSRIEGSFELPDRMRLVEDDGSTVSESVRVPGGVYSRDADNREELGTKPWVYTEIHEPQPGVSGVSVIGNIDSAGHQALSTASAVFGAFGSSFDLSELLSRVNGVRRVSPGVLEATLKQRDLIPPALVTAIETQISAARANGGSAPGSDFDAHFLDDPVTIRLTHGDDGRLDQIGMKSESGTGEDRTVEDATMSFSDWGKPVQIVAPAASDVDPTPSIDEAEIASFREFVILAPAPPPAEMVLKSAAVDSTGFTEAKGCGSAHLSYAAKADEGAPDPGVSAFEAYRTRPFLSLTQTAASCQDNGFIGLEPTGSAAEAVQVGSYSGELRQHRIGRDNTSIELLDVRFTVGDVVVNAQTNLPKDGALATLANLVPLDLASQPIEPSVPPGG